MYGTYILIYRLRYIYMHRPYIQYKITNISVYCNEIVHKYILKNYDNIKKSCGTSLEGAPPLSSHHFGTFGYVADYTEKMCPEVDIRKRFPKRLAFLDKRQCTTCGAG